MARIRSVHPSLFTDESWVGCSPLARILYIGLWTDADDQGLFEWRPLQLKMRLLPGDVGDVGAMLDELASVGLVRRFEVAGRPYGAIGQFRKFQRPKKPNAIHPITPEITEYVCLSAAGSEPVPHPSGTDGENSPQMEDGGGRMEDTVETDVPTVTHASKSGFDEWWGEYPDAVAQPAARKAYAAACRKIGGDDPDAVLLEGLRRSIASARWANPNHTRPNPARWLSEERWRDRDPPALAVVKASSAAVATAITDDFLERRRAMLKKDSVDA